MDVTWDNLWSIEGLVAVGTLLLAAATFALAWVTVGMDRQAGRQVEIAREQAGISRSAFQMSYRPLIVGVPPGLPEHQVPVTVQYADGDEVELPDLAAIDLAKRPDGALRLSVPFRNTGNGVALLIGAWARTRVDEQRVSGGSTLSTVTPGEVARIRLLPYGNPSIEEAMERGEVVIFGIQYTDAEGQQNMYSEIEVAAEPSTGNRVAGRTTLYREGEPFASTAW